MLRIIEDFWTHLYPRNDDVAEGSSGDVFKAVVSDVRASEGLSNNRYSEIVRKVAELGYLNPQYNILFRGQVRDHTTKSGNSIIYGRIFRPENIKGRLEAEDVSKRFRVLNEGCPE